MMTQTQGKTKNSWCVYILECSDNTYYTGITNDLENRLAQHRCGTGAKYTKGRTPLNLIYQEKCESRSAASKREYTIKNLSRLEKQALIKTGQHAENY